MPYLYKKLFDYDAENPRPATAWCIGMTEDDTINNNPIVKITLDWMRGIRRRKL